MSETNDAAGAEGAGRGRRRPMPKIVAAIVAVIAVAWSAVWFYGRGRALEEVDRALAGLAARGVSIVCPEREVGGFPFRMELSCRQPGVTIAATGASGSATALRVVAQVWNPLLVIAELDGPLVGEDGAGTRVTATWRTLRASVRLSARGPERISVASTGLDLAVAPREGVAVGLTGEHVEAHGQRSGERDLDLAVTGASTAVKVGGAAVGPRRADLGLTVRLNEAIPFGPGEPVRAFAARGGRIEPIGFDFASGGVTVHGKGEMTIGRDGVLDGSIGLAAKGLEAVVSGGAELGPDLQKLLGAFVLLGKTSTDPDLPGRRLDLIIERGRPRFGRLVGPPLPLLFRP